MPDTIRNAFNIPLKTDFSPMRGMWESNEEYKFHGKCDYGFGWAHIADIKKTALFEGTVKWREGTQAFGLMIHTSGPKLEKWCQLRIEPGREQIAMERYNQIDGDQMYTDERRIRFDKCEARVQAVFSGNIIQVYVNDTALTTRCYSVTEGGLGLFVECGETDWSSVAVMEGNENDELV